MTKQKQRGGIILHVAILFLLGIIATGIIAYVTQRVRSDANVKLQAESHSAEIANDVELAIREYPAYRWLMNYWYKNCGSLDIEYDADFSGGTLTEEKYRVFKEHNPELQMKYLSLSEVRSLSQEDQKLYAEVCYSWLLTRINQIKQAHSVDYLFCVLTDAPFDSQFFLFSAADPGSVRGTNYEEVYPLGHQVRVSGSQQEAMRYALVHSSHLADAGSYVDYYSFLCEFDEHAVLVGLTYSLADLRADIDAMTRRGTAFAVGYQILLSALCLGLIALFVLRPLRKIQKNIRLYKNTKDSATVAKNLANVHPHNEIGQLSGDVVELTSELDRYMNQLESITAERERIGTELALATRIQSSMIPHSFPPFPERSEFDLYAAMDPAKEVGGDFYDFFLIDKDHLCLLIADVSGKGIPAALFMMASQIILKSCAMLGKSAAEILSKTNEAICSNNQAEMFVTVWLGILEISTGILTAANAGHEYPVLKQGERFQVRRNKHSFVIGGMEGIKYKEYTFQLEPGDKLFLYTDGVPEATDAENRMFGAERMLATLNEAPDAGPEQIITRMRGAVDAFVQNAEQFDDLTMLCMEYHGKDSQKNED